MLIAADEWAEPLLFHKGSRMNVMTERRSCNHSVIIAEKW